jgi:hypothetical protein
VLVIGSTQLVQLLIAHDLVNEFRGHDRRRRELTGATNREPPLALVPTEARWCRWAAPTIVGQMSQRLRWTKGSLARRAPRYGRGDGRGARRCRDGSPRTCGGSPLAMLALQPKGGGAGAVPPAWGLAVAG